MLSGIYNFLASFNKKQVVDQPIAQPMLFTPGPIVTTSKVKLSMNYDYGSRDPQFLKLVSDIRNDILKIANDSNPLKYTTIILQGSGTYGVEATIGTAIPKKSFHKFLIIQNGAYGMRMETMAKYYGLNYCTLYYKDNQVVKTEDVVKFLQLNNDVTHVAVVHSETTSGIINPIQDICPAIKAINPNVFIINIVDAVSSFGLYEVKPEEWGIDFLISTSNKNLQGVPGFAFVLANIEKLENCQSQQPIIIQSILDNSRSLSLDLYEQWKGLEVNGQFRFTPPTHVLKAFKTAVDEYFERGGRVARYKRYSSNQKLISSKMEELGFQLYIEKQYQGAIITTFMQPTHKNWDFNEFYNYLASKKLVIYPGKLTEGLSFRIGSIGEVYEKNVLELIEVIKQYLAENKIETPISN